MGPMDMLDTLMFMLLVSVMLSPRLMLMPTTMVPTPMPTAMLDTPMPMDMLDTLMSMLLASVMLMLTTMVPTPMPMDTLPTPMPMLDTLMPMASKKLEDLSILLKTIT